MDSEEKCVPMTSTTEEAAVDAVMGSVIRDWTGLKGCFCTKTWRCGYCAIRWGLMALATARASTQPLEDLVVRWREIVAINDKLAKEWGDLPIGKVQRHLAIARAHCADDLEAVIRELQK